MFSCLVVSDSLGPHGLQPTRLLCPWNSPGKNTGVGSHFLLPGIFLIQGSNLHLLPWQAGSVDGSTTEPLSGKLLPGGSDSKESACSAGDPGSILGQEDRLEGGNGNQFQYSCQENSMDRGAWWAAIHGVAKSDLALTNNNCM